MTGSEPHESDAGDGVPNTPQTPTGSDWPTYQPPSRSAHDSPSAQPEWGQGWGQAQVPDPYGSSGPTPPQTSAPSGSYASAYPHQGPAYGAPAGSYPGQPGYPGYGAYSPAPPNQAQAITAMVLGIISLVGAPLTCGLALLLGPVALILGYRSGREIDASAGRLGGKGQATAGFVMGIIASVLMIPGLPFFLLVMLAL